MSAEGYDQRISHVPAMPRARTSSSIGLLKLLIGVDETHYLVGEVLLQDLSQLGFFHGDQPRNRFRRPARSTGGLDALYSAAARSAASAGDRLRMLEVAPCLLADREVADAVALHQSRSGLDLPGAIGRRRGRLEGSGRGLACHAVNISLVQGDRSVAAHTETAAAAATMSSTRRRPRALSRFISFPYS